MRNKHSKNKYKVQLTSRLDIGKVVVNGAIISACIWTALLWVVGGLMASGASSSSSLVIGNLIAFKGEVAGSVLYLALGTAIYSSFSLIRCLFTMDRFGLFVIPIVFISVLLSTSFFQVLTENALAVGSVVGFALFQIIYFIRSYRLRYLSLLKGLTTDDQGK